MEKETVILDLQIEQGDAISELEKTKKSIVSLKEEQQELNKAYKAGNVTLDEYASESVRLEGILKKQTNQYNTLQKSTSGVVTQFDKLIAANQKIAKNVGDQNEKFKEFANNVNVGGVSIGDLTGKLTSFINPATAVAGAVSALAGFYLSSAAGARDLESAQNQLSTSFKTISNDLAELLGADGKGGGFLSQLAFQLNATIFGRGAAGRGLLVDSALRALQELEVQQLNAQQVAKNTLAEAEKLRRVRDDDTKSYAVRKKAAEDALGFINVREQVLVNQQQERLKQLRILLALDKNNLELQKEIKQAEFEISDIREDSEGKRTELLTGINNLQKQQNTELQREIELKNQLIKVNDRLNQTSETETKQYEAKIKGTIDAGNGIKKLIGVLDEEAEKRKQNAQIEQLLQQQKIDGLQTTIRLATGLINEQSNFGKAAASAQATIDTYVAANLALSTYPPPFGAIAAALNIALGLANVAKINSIPIGGQAAGGGKFMTKGPTMLLVGDNPGGVERVTVEPISGRGKTKVNGNLVQMAGGGVLETQAVTNPINQSFAFRGIMDKIEVVASWKEFTELQTRIDFKQALVTR